MEIVDQDNTMTPSSKLPVWSPDCLDINDAVRLHRPLLGSKVKYSNNLQRRVIEEKLQKDKDKLLIQIPF